MTLHVRRVDSFHRVVLFPFRFVTTFRLQEGQNTVVGWSRRTSLTSWNVFARGFGGGESEAALLSNAGKTFVGAGKADEGGRSTPNGTEAWLPNAEVLLIQRRRKEYRHGIPPRHDNRTRILYRAHSLPDSWHIAAKKPHPYWTKCEKTRVPHRKHPIVLSAGRKGRVLCRSVKEAKMDGHDYVLMIKDHCSFSSQYPLFSIEKGIHDYSFLSL